MKFDDTQESDMTCSFCGKRDDQVRRLIAGRGVYICDECIAFCQDMLDEDTLKMILTEPKNSIIKQYVKLMKIDGVELNFSDEVLDMIVDKAMESNLGARGLRSIVETIMVDLMYETPSTKKKKIDIDPSYAKEKLSTLNYDVQN